MKHCPQCQQTYADSHAYCSRDGIALVLLEELAPGTIFRRRYEIISELGRGGMGVVYKAHHTLLKEFYAIKVINRNYATNVQAVQRFLSEAQLANQIDDRHIVRVFDADETEEGQPFIVMEYVPGQSLRQILRADAAYAQKPIDPLRAINLASQACEALASAHRHHIIHRDIKPDNILVGTDDLVKIVDFGLAKAKSELHGTVQDTGLSESGVFMGTPRYCSPEQAMLMRGDQLDERSDIYSLGVVLFEMLVGEPPFSGDAAEVLHHHKVTPPPRPQTLRPDLILPEPLVNVVMIALQKKPAQRFATADTMRNALLEARQQISGNENSLFLEMGATAIVPTVFMPALEPAVRVPPTETQERAVPIIRKARLRSAAVAVAAVVLFAGVFGALRYRNAGQERHGTAAVKQMLATGRRLLDPQQGKHELNDYDRAIAIFEEVQKLDPSNADAAAGIQSAKTERSISQAEAAIDRGNFDEAIHTLREDILARDPTNARAQAALDMALQKKILGR